MIKMKDEFFDRIVKSFKDNPSIPLLREVYQHRNETIKEQQLENTENDVILPFLTQHLRQESNKHIQTGLKTLVEIYTAKQERIK